MKKLFLVIVALGASIFAARGDTLIVKGSERTGTRRDRLPRDLVARKGGTEPRRA